MKRKLVIVLIALFSLVLVACGKKDRDTGKTGGKFVEWYELAETANYNGEPVTIRFWHRMGKQNQELLQQFIREFNEIFPNIKVEENKEADDYDLLSDSIALAITAGDQPDLAESYPDHIARYGKAVLALNNFIDHSVIGFTAEEKSDFLSSLWNEGMTYDNEGTILSLPFTKSSEALFYNKTYFDLHGYTAPQTWEEVFEIAEDIKKREPEAIPFGYDSESNFFITASEQWGAPYTGFDEKGRGAVLFNNDLSKDMVKYFKDKVDRGLMLTQTLNSNSNTSNIMKTGEKLYMYVGSTGGTRYAYSGTLIFGNEYLGTGYRVGVAPVPVKDMNNRKQIQQGPNINLFNSGNEQKMIASWLFAKFLLEPEQTARFGLQSGYAPVRNSAYETQAWLDYTAGIKEDPQTVNEAIDKLIKEAIELFKDNEDIFFTSTVFNLSSKSRKEVGSLLVKILSYDAATQEDLNNYINQQYQSSYTFITR